MISQKCAWTSIFHRTVLLELTKHTSQICNIYKCMLQKAHPISSEELKPSSCICNFRIDANPIFVAHHDTAEGNIQANHSTTIVASEKYSFFFPFYIGSILFNKWLILYIIYGILTLRFLDLDNQSSDSKPSILPKNETVHLSKSNMTMDNKPIWRCDISYSKWWFSSDRHVSFVGCWSKTSNIDPLPAHHPACCHSLPSLQTFMSAL